MTALSHVSPSLRPQTLLFQHVPKTAGTSVRAALAPLYRPDERVFIYDWDNDKAVRQQQFPELPLDRRSRLRLVMGHFSYGLHEYIPQPSSYVTMLRDPVDRVASLFFHFLGAKAPPEGSEEYREQQAILSGEFTVEDWVFQRRNTQADNHMVRAIAGRPGLPFGTCTQELLDEALDHIDQDYAAVLLQESMNESAQILIALVGKPIGDIGHQNVNARRKPTSELDPRTRKRLLELNEFDVRLYRDAVRRFPATHERFTRRSGPT